MQFNVSQLMREPIGSRRESPLLEELRGLPPTLPRQKVEGSVRLLRTDRGILASVRVRLTAQLECSRCLRPLTQRLDVRFTEEYLPTVDVLSGAPLEFGDAAEAFRIDEHHILEIEEAVRQYSMTSEPMAPLCREECRGLCPQCGVDLNEGVCRCQAVPDARWAGLARLLVTDDREGEEN